ncbi:hypothetical protein BH10PSE6_BH10PSE6_20910 [soil metagenome]
MGGWSYLWAGLFGAFYVWRKGFGKLFLKAFAINLAYGLLFVGFFFVTLTFIRSAFQWYALQIVVLPILILAQGASMLRMLRDAYRRRGWMIRPG